MKFLQLLFLIGVLSCNQQEKNPPDPLPVEHEEVKQDKKDIPAKDSVIPQSKSYSNKHFRDVRVEQTGQNTFRITGKAQVFEAAFSWVVEDGHEELLSGHESTDAGAPEFGKFRFTITAKKKRPNSTLHLLLFEASAKDGSRQHELPVPLY